MINIHQTKERRRALETLQGNTLAFTINGKVVFASIKKQYGIRYLQVVGYDPENIMSISAKDTGELKSLGKKHGCSFIHIVIGTITDSYIIRSGEVFSGLSDVFKKSFEKNNPTLKRSFFDRQKTKTLVYEKNCLNLLGSIQNNEEYTIGVAESQKEYDEFYDSFLVNVFSFSKYYQLIKAGFVKLFTVRKDGVLINGVIIVASYETGVAGCFYYHNNKSLQELMNFCAQHYIVDLRFNAFDTVGSFKEKRVLGARRVEMLGAYDLIVDNNRYSLMRIFKKYEGFFSKAIFRSKKVSEV